MSDKRLKLSQELDKLIVLFYKKPTKENKKNLENKRQELYAVTE